MEQNPSDVRQIPEMQAIANYLQGMTFKRKPVGGVDADSVLQHFSQVAQQYEAIIADCLTRSRAYTQQAAGLQARLAQNEQENAAWDQYYRELAQWHESASAQLSEQNERLLRETMALQAAAGQQRWSGYVPG